MASDARKVERSTGEQRRGGAAPRVPLISVSSGAVGQPRATSSQRHKAAEQQHTCERAALGCIGPTMYSGTIYFFRSDAHKLRETLRKENSCAQFSYAKQREQPEEADCAHGVQVTRMSKLCKPSARGAASNSPALSSESSPKKNLALTVSSTQSAEAVCARG